MTSKNSSSTSKSSSSTSSSAAQKKSELNELTEDLNSTKPEVKKEALKKVIANMTVGKDVAPLFQAVIKCIEVNDIEIKKLVYLYIINNSRTRPDDAIMVISLFRKDIQNKTSPLLRALAARTMGCVRVKKLNDYLIDPLREALTDDDPYVKKTAILCIPKVYEISPELIEQNGIIETLNKMLEKEGNAYVISNILCALNELSAFKNKNLLNINFSNVQKLTLALNECGEWSQIYILESLATYHPNDVKESEELIDRVIPRLGHINPAVVLTAIKVIIKYMDYLTNDEHIRALCKKISPPIASLLARPPEVQYVALKNIRFLLEKQPHLLEKEIRAFFIKFNDPYYIKLEKLEILTRLCDNRNFDVVITELAEYANDVDQEFSRKSLKALAKICIKVDKAAEKCIEIIKKILSECKKALHIAHECAIVLQIVLRKFPEKFDYDPIMKEFCEFLTEMDEGEAKASLIWVIGEYAEKISNSEHLIAKAAENFLTEPACVQLQLLTATVKLYLKKPDEAEQLVQDILSLASEQNEIPDVRDRGFIYWRLLSSDPEKTKKIVLSDRPVLADDVVTFEESLLENLVNNISNVSSVYYKPPETIIPKILVDYNKDDQAADKEAEVQKAKQDSDKAKKAEEQKKNDAEEKRKEKEREKERERQAELDKKAKEEEKKQKETGKDDKKGFKGLRKPGEPIPQGGDLKTGGTKSGGVNLLDSDDEPAPVKTTSNGTSGQTGNAGNTGGGANLLDFEDEEPATNNVQSGGGLLDFDSKPQFHQVPFETVLTASNAGAKGNKGVALAARFIRENGKLILNLKLTNSAANIVKDFDSQLKPNCFGLKLEKLPGISLNPGETTEVKVNVLNTAQADSNPPPNPLLFVAGLKSSLDVFYFNTPCSFHTLLTEDGALDSKEFKRLWKETEGSDVIQELPSVNPKLKNVEKLKEHLQANNLFFLTSRVNEMSQTVAYFTAKSISGVYFLLEVNVPSSKNPNGCGLTVRTLQRPLAPLLMQAVITILSNAN